MQAAAYDRYGPAEVVSFREVPTPRLRGDEVLVRVEAAALNPKDVVIRGGKFRVLSGRTFPKRIGFDLAGRVMDLGWRVPTAFAGTRVFGFYDGYKMQHGSIAELAAIPADQVAVISRELAAPLAAATPLAGSTALQALRDDAQLQAGQRILIVGASGGVGTFAVQIAKLLGAHVAASVSARNADLARSLGADDVFDYASADPLGLGPYDAVLDCFGRLRAKHVAPVLTPHGRFIALVPSRRIFRDIVAGRVMSPRTTLTSVKARTSDLSQLGGWLATGRLRPVIDHVYARAELQDAMLRLETRHARGKVIIQLG